MRERERERWDGMGWDGIVLMVDVPKLPNWLNTIEKEGN
jgi:hypothetical protein